MWATQEQAGRQGGDPKSNGMYRYLSTGWLVNAVGDKTIRVERFEADDTIGVGLVRGTACAGIDRLYFTKNGHAVPSVCDEKTGERLDSIGGGIESSGKGGEKEKGGGYGKKEKGYDAQAY